MALSMYIYISIYIYPICVYIHVDVFVCVNTFRTPGPHERDAPKLASSLGAPG